MTHHRPREDFQPDHQAGPEGFFPVKRFTAFSLLVLSTLWLFARKRQASVQHQVRFYSRYLDRMARAGHPKAPHETGWEFAKRLSLLDPQLAGLAQETTVRYYQVRFAGKPS